MSGTFRDSRDSVGSSARSTAISADPRSRVYHAVVPPPGALAHSSSSSHSGSGSVSGAGEMKAAALSGWDPRYPPLQYGRPSVASAPDIGGEYVTAAAASFIPATLAFEHNHWTHPKHSGHGRQTQPTSHHHFAPPPPGTMAVSGDPAASAADPASLAMHAARAPMLAPDIPTFAEPMPRRVKPMYPVAQAHYDHHLRPPPQHSLQPPSAGPTSMMIHPHRSDLRPVSHAHHHPPPPAGAGAVSGSSSHSVVGSGRTQTSAMNHHHHHQHPHLHHPSEDDHGMSDLPHGAQESYHRHIRMPPEFASFHSDPRHGGSQHHSSKYFEGAPSLEISGVRRAGHFHGRSPDLKPPIPGDSPPAIGFSSSEGSISETMLVGGEGSGKSADKSRDRHHHIEDVFELNPSQHTSELDDCGFEEPTTVDASTSMTPSRVSPAAEVNSSYPIREDAVAANSGALTRIGRPKSRCPHFDTSSMIYADCCQQWFGCIICHDFIMLNSEHPHYLVPSTVTKMICLKCKSVQSCSQYCYQCQNELCSKSSMSSRRMLKLSAVSEYYCPVCKYWDSNKPLEKFHCVGCNQCRIRDQPSISTFDVCSPAATSTVDSLGKPEIPIVKPDGNKLMVESNVPNLDNGSSSRSFNTGGFPKLSPGKQNLSSDVEILNDSSLLMDDKDDGGSDSDKSDGIIVKKSIKDETMRLDLTSPPMVKRDLSISDSSSLSMSQKRALDKEHLQMLRQKATIQADSDTDTEEDDVEADHSSYLGKSPVVTEDTSPPLSITVTAVKSDRSLVKSGKEVTVIEDEKGFEDSSGLVFLDTVPLKDANSSNEDSEDEDSENADYTGSMFTNAERPSLRMIDEAKPEQPTPKAELPSVLTMKLKRSTPQSTSGSPAGSVHSPLTPNCELCSLCRITAQAKLRMSACRARLRKRPMLATCVKCDCGLATQGPYWTEVFFSCFRHGFHLECIQSSSDLLSDCPVCSVTPEGTHTPSTISPISHAGGRVGTPPHGLMAPHTSASQVKMPSLGLSPGMLRTLMDSRVGVWARPIPAIHAASSDRLWTAAAAVSPHGSLSLSRMAAMSDQTNVTSRRGNLPGFRKKKKKDKKRNTLESPMTVTSRFYGTVSFEIGERMQRLLAESKFDDIPFNSLLTTALQNRCTDSENGYKLFRRHGFKFYFTQSLDEWCDVTIAPKQLQKFREKGAKQRKKREQDKAKHFIEKRIQKRLEKQRASVVDNGRFRGDAGGGSIVTRHSTAAFDAAAQRGGGPSSSSKPVPRMAHRSASDGDWRSRATHRSRRNR